MGKRYFSGLNLIRIFLSLYIACIIHYGLFMTFDAEILNFKIVKAIALYITGAGLDIFFLMSGFVSYGSSFKKIREGTLSFKEFSYKKFIRLYPLTITTTLYIFIIQKIFFIRYGYFMEPFSQGNGYLPLILSLLNIESGWFFDGSLMAVNEPAWYISILIICYLIYFFITKLIKSEKITLIIYGIIALFGFFLLLLKLDIPFLFYNNGRGYLSFFMGLIFGKITEVLYDNFDEKKIKKTGLLSIIFLILYIIFRRFDLPFTVGSITLNIFILFVSVIYLSESPLSDNKIVSYLSGLSFSIYLLHIPVIFTIRFFNNYLNLGINYAGRKCFLFLFILVILVPAALDILKCFTEKHIKTIIKPWKKEKN